MKLSQLLRFVFNYSNDFKILKSRHENFPATSGFFRNEMVSALGITRALFNLHEGAVMVRRAHAVVVRRAR